MAELTAVATQPKPLIPEHIGREIAQVQIQLQELLPPDIQPTQFQAALQIHLSTVQNLDRANPSTVMAAIVKMARYGFLAGEEAYIVVYKNTAQFIPDYRGLVKDIYRSPRVRKVVANPVYKNDTFTLDVLGEVFKHEEALSDPGEVVAFYAAIWLKGEEKPDVHLMRKEDVDKVKANAPGAQQDPWQKHYIQMARKTALKRGAKYWNFPDNEPGTSIRRLLEEEDKLDALPPSFEQASASSELLFGHPMNDHEGKPAPRQMTAQEGPSAPPAPPTPTAWRPPQREEQQAPVVGETPITGASPQQQAFIRRLGEQRKWSDAKIDEYIASLPSVAKASDAIRELQAAVKARREEEGQVSPGHRPPRAFANRLATMGRWKPWRDVAEEFVKNKNWDWGDLTPTQRAAIAHVVVGVAPPPWVDLYDERWNGIMKWGKESNIEPYDLGIWAVDKYASGNAKDSLDYKPKDMPDDAIEAIQAQINQGDSSLVDEIRAHAETCRQL